MCVLFIGLLLSGVSAKLARSLASESCTVSLWGGHIDDETWQASINRNAQAGKTYKIACCWNGIGNMEGISSGTISSGCPNVTMKDINNRTLCVLGPGSYPAGSFQPKCGNDVVTEYTIGSWGGSTTSTAKDIGAKLEMGFIVLAASFLRLLF